jgi:hypothetical protein
VSERIFVQANDNQLVAAKVAKFALETRGRAAARGVPVTIMNVDEMPPFKELSGVAFRCGSETIRYDRGHVQSFTLSRFLPPAAMSYSGRALVLDPDVLALSDVGELFSLDLEGNAVAACRRDMGWETSVMLLDCAKLSHWRIEDIFARLKDLSLDYLDLMWLRNEPGVLELPGVWNSHDKIGPGVRMLHMTRVNTQPWKTGLPIGTTLHEPPVLGFIPRTIARRLVGKPEPRYRRHPDSDVERTFLTVFKDAVAAGAVSEAEVSDAVARQLIRPDIWDHVA